jgi:hypothetical protein
LEGGHAGEPAEFTIEAYNRLGDPLTQGGDPFKVTVKGISFSSTKIDSFQDLITLISLLKLLTTRMESIL